MKHMLFANGNVWHRGWLTLLGLALFAPIVLGQNQLPEPQPEVFRINTELVQTGVMVFDKKGQFVEGLKPEQFELRVDGKRVQFTFFDRVTAWTAREEKQVAAAAGAAPAPASTRPNVVDSSSRGRTVLFFVDDLHLSLDSLGKTRSALNHFIDHQMTPFDQVAITSASGQIGFLQQLTDNRAVLRAALGRINPVPYVVLDRDQPPMTEFIAIQIVNGDREALNFYAEELLRRSFRSMGGKIKRENMYEMIKNRANNIIKGLEAVTNNSLGALENLLQTSGQIRGRKLVFFISDGFYLHTTNSIGPANERLRRVTDIANRTGSVIYTIDARGLFAPMAEAMNDRPFDPSGRLDRSNMGEGMVSQDGMNALAGDTGGRALRNQNYFDTWVSRMLEETSNYYLLAWRPEADEQKGVNFKHVEVTIAGRPDLTVRLPKGFLLQSKSPARVVNAKAAMPDITIPSSASVKGPETALIAALSAPSARKGLPTQLAASFVDVPGSGPVLTVATQMATNALGYGIDGKQTAAIDLAGVILNDRGKQAGSFKTRVNVNPSSQADTENPVVIYSHKIPIKPGLYQVRVAARDDKSGEVGSAADWIEIPELGSKRLALSSLLLGGQVISSNHTQAGGGEQVQFSVDRRFPRNSHLNFLTIVYNAARGSNGQPNLDAQIQISRNGQPVVTSPPRGVAIDATTDLARIVHGADIALQSLPPGRYRLQVTISDRIANTQASSEVSFEIE
ncbi:MAG: hypothetical protein QOD75_1982 [Blastocatellia bacterium]|jgi:VWFA-related protein|nr:hypothetical protein [Blastocatellia bacterium]